MYESFVCMYGCALHACLTQWRSEEAIISSETGVMGVLAVEAVSSAKAARFLNTDGSISPVPRNEIQKGPDR